MTDFVRPERKAVQEANGEAFPMLVEALAEADLGPDADAVLRIPSIERQFSDAADALLSQLDRRGVGLVVHNVIPLGVYPPRLVSQPEETPFTTATDEVNLGHGDGPPEQENGEPK